VKKQYVSLTIPAQAAFIDIVRLTLYGVASKAGFSYEEIEDMKVAVSEACNNAVLHAYDEHLQGMIEIAFEVELDTICIAVKDSGKSFQYEQVVSKSAALHNISLSEAVTGGLGIFMMNALMDNVEIRTELGTEVILTKRIGRKEGML